MQINKPLTKKYKPTNRIAYVWLAEAKKKARNQRSPFQGRGNLNAYKTALENGLLTQDEIDEVFQKCVSVSPDELYKVFNKLWALNGQQHFPLQSLETEDGQLIVPPTLTKVLEEYLAQIDYVAESFERFLPFSERKGTSYKHGERLDLFYNPGTRVTPDEYEDWISQWIENGPPKELWHRRIATTVKLPNRESEFERWNQTLSNARRLTPNGVEIIDPKAKYARKLKGRLSSQGEKPLLDNNNVPLEPEVEPVGYPPMNVEQLLKTIEQLFIANMRPISRLNSSNIAYAAKIVSRLAEKIFPPIKEINYPFLDENELIQEIKKFKRHQTIRENLQTEWTNSFAALNDISEELFGQNLKGIHSRIVEDLALRTLGMIPQKRLNTGAQEFLDQLRPNIPSGPISRPIFER